MSMMKQLLVMMNVLIKRRELSLTMGSAYSVDTPYSHISMDILMVWEGKRTMCISLAYTAALMMITEFLASVRINL